MSYDFPASPTDGQEYTPPVGGQTYIYKPPRWLVKGIPPVGGGGGDSTGIEEAPLDGQQYGRVGATGSWTAVVPNPDISGKADKTYVDAQDALKADKTYVDAQDALKADKTYVDAQDALKANIASPTFTGDPKAPTPAAADNDTSIATTAFVKLAIDAIPAAAAATYIGTAAPASPTPGQMWWDSDSGRLYIYYADGDTSQWVEAVTAPVDLTGFVRETKGTFVPAIEGMTAAGVGTYSRQEGRWLRQGSVCFVDCSLVWSAHTGTGSMQIGSLPFLPSVAPTPVISVYYSDIAITGSQVGAYLSVGGKIVLRQMGNNQAAGGINVDAAASISVSFSYVVLEGQ